MALDCLLLKALTLWLSQWLAHFCELSSSLLESLEPSELDELEELWGAANTASSRATVADEADAAGSILRPCRSHFATQRGLNLQHAELPTFGSNCNTEMAQFATHIDLQTMLLNDQGHPAIRPSVQGLTCVPLWHGVSLVSSVYTRLRRKLAGK